MPWPWHQPIWVGETFGKVSSASESSGTFYKLLCDSLMAVWHLSKNDFRSLSYHDWIIVMLPLCFGITGGGLCIQSVSPLCSASELMSELELPHRSWCPSWNFRVGADVRVGISALELMSKLDCGEEIWPLHLYTFKLHLVLWINDSYLILNKSKSQFKLLNWW